ncbi:MAG: DUF2914 domain-containing protein [Aestuariibacter sp.]
MSALADIARAQLTSAVENKEPVDDLGSLVFGRPNTIEKVLYFTHVTDMAEKTLVHRWILNGNVVAEVELSIGSDNWRTYSSKRIAPGMSGNWRVEAWGGDSLLGSHEFVYELANQ